MTGLDKPIRIDQAPTLKVASKEYDHRLLRLGRQHSLAQVPKAAIARSTFDRSSNLKTTFDSGKLIPVFCEEILPGDTMNLKTSLFARIATPITALMDNLYLDFFFFFVPNRLVWDKWAFFMGEEEVPGDAQLAPKYGVPWVPVTNAQNGTVYDYLGMPTRIAGSYQANALPLRGMNLIWNEWFRDENLQTRKLVRKDGGVLPGPTPVDLQTDFDLYPRGKRHDYFTSALPWPIKGPAVLLPLGSVAPVVAVTPGTSFPTFTLSEPAGTDPVAPFTANANGTAGTIQPTNWIPNVNYGPIVANPTLRWSATGLQANLAGATASTINELRQAFQIQRLLERDARGGTRLTELIKSHFGVVSPDQRLQRPEYLGGGSVPISINPVPQTTATGTTGGTTPQGNLAAFGTAAGQGGGFTQSFTEHGFVIGFCCARADLTYQYGLNKMWSRSTRFDYYWPALQAIGEQAILNKEIFLQATAADLLPFGYQERWAEYRYRPNMLTGKMRSNDPQSLDIWHLAQEFAALPTLSATFIADTPPMDRVVAVPTEPEFILDAFFNLKHTRPMPVYSVPGMIDHF